VILINDTFGHSAGDLCLQAVANCINDSIRVSDLLFRCGGEEFLVLLSQTEHEGAFQLAERIREHVRDLTLPIVGDTPLTVSLGVTQLRLQDDMRSLYDRADNALYQAKRSGRNRVKAL
jgi:diguanylate cyclase (GGDEF)-like protein